MSDRLQELAVFVRAAESGSFSRAARELGLSQPSVSRIIGELKARLGVKLLLRTTRRITVTDAGALFLDRAREILAEIEDAEDAARGLDSLRGHHPPCYARGLRHPRDHSAAAGIPGRASAAAGRDVGLRRSGRIWSPKAPMSRSGSAELDDSVFGARKLATLQRMLVASPAYLQSPRHAENAGRSRAHDCIFGPGNFGRESWSFCRNGTEISVDVRGRVHTNSGPGVFASVMAGLGIAMVIDGHGRRRNQGRHAGPAAARLQA